MKRNIIIETLLAGALCIAGTACSPKRSGSAAEERAAAKPRVTTEVVRARDVEMQSVFTGNAEGYAVNNITPQSARRISRLLVDAGDHVTAGQKIAEMDNSSLAQAKVQYENSRSAYERAKELYEFGGESKANWEAALTSYEVAKATYENLLENTTLVSPISGVVTARNYDNGDMVGALPIFVVQQIRPVKIVVNVSESLYSYVKTGMGVEAAFDALQGRTFAGRVSRITPAVDTGSRTFPVEIVISNDDEAIKPGMYGRVTMTYGTRNSVVVPDRSVVKQLGSGDRYVYVLGKEGTVAFRKVELGARKNDTYEILSGLEDGDEVVVTGQNALKDGTAVERIEG